MTCSTPSMAPTVAAGGPVVAAPLQAAVADLGRAVAALQAVLQSQAGASALGSGPAMGAPVAPMAAAPAQAASTAPASQGSSSQFNVASFNALGASHTAAGGNKPQYRSGAERTKGLVDTLERHVVDVAGLQEFQGSQQAAFRQLAPGYAMHGHDDNVIVWNTERFRKTDSRTLEIPYFEGKPRKMPVVQLEDRATGKRAWFINVHNPADTKAHRAQGAYRAEAVRRERALVQQLEASGMPVYLVGDFNDNAVDSKLSAGTSLESSLERGQKGIIDWVFGSGGVRFDDNVIDASPRSSGTSDHRIVVARTSYA